MTDKPQELDEILENLTTAASDGKFIDDGSIGEAKVDILNWHNKQVATELEALREEAKHEDLRTISQVITARIDKLTEAEL